MQTRRRRVYEEAVRTGGFFSSGADATGVGGWEIRFSE
jgi:hypothetical protein